MILPIRKEQYSSCSVQNNIGGPNDRAVCRMEAIKLNISRNWDRFDRDILTVRTTIVCANDEEYRQYDREDGDPCSIRLASIPVSISD